ncbi:CHASE domain-containing protein [Herbaspirillum huttiense]|uniref:CHASE domain-containing protein n=1 Tax=Herbaspirillum huttiense TaxID=863372 RepID=UPI002E78F08C|nr:CHASE domain-containing protein [Herbaspirillum huttiense]MEE1639671.1 CHASE domain-containing protein [Herbaspirillum huttiense NC40101]
MMSLLNRLKTTNLRGSLTRLAASLGISVAMIVICMFAAHKYNHEHLQASFQATLTETQKIIYERLRRYEYGLRGMRGAIAVADPQSVTEEQLNIYVRTRDIPSEFPGAKGIGYIQLVKAEEKDNFLKNFRRKNGFEIEIRNLNPYVGDLYVIRYISPRAPNLNAMGLNIASEEKRRHAADASARTGRATLTAPIVLVQDPTKIKQSFLFLLPIYAPGEHDSPAERVRALRGWSYSPLSMNEVLGDGGIDPEKLHLKISDVSAGEQPAIIFDSGNNSRFKTTDPSVHGEVDIYGRRWATEITFSKAFVASQGIIPLWWLFVLLLSLAALANVFVYIRLRREQESRTLQLARTELAMIVDSSIDAIIGKNIDGVVTSWNRGAEALFGYTSREAIGQRLLELIVPVDRHNEEIEILTAVRNGKSLSHFETKRNAKDGRLLDVLTCSPI